MASKLINCIPVLHLLTFIATIIPCRIDAFSINLIRIDSIESPLFPKNLSKEERQQKL